MTDPTPSSSGRRVGRRTLLLASIGGAGVLVGGGATEVVRASAGGPADPPKLPSAGEELMTEHGVLNRILLAYRAIGDRLTSGRAVDGGLVTDAAQIVSDYIEGFHEGLEEAYVFPRVAPHDPGLVRTLLVQHDRGRHLTAAILSAAAGDLRRPSVRTSLSRWLASFVAMYEPHEAWEDTVVFPTLRTVTDERTLEALAARFADLENKQYGDNALAQMLDRVQGIEAQLGLDDLSRFTPPAP